MSSGSAFAEKLVDTAISGPEKRIENAILTFAWLSGFLGDNRIRLNHVAHLKQNNQYEQTLAERAKNLVLTHLPTIKMGGESREEAPQKLSSKYNRLTHLCKEMVKSPNILFGLTSIGVSLSMLVSPDIGNY